jgi:hypothetical protein
MGEINLTDAFGSYKAKPPKHGARSVMTPTGALVLSCFYGRFQRAQASVLRYEEDLTEEKGAGADLLRKHLAEALAQEAEVRAVIAMAENQPVIADSTVQIPKPKRTTFHARKDLLGKVTFFDGQKFTIDFKKDETVTS